MRSELLLSALLIGTAGPISAQGRLPSGWSVCGRGGRALADSTHSFLGRQSLLLLAPKPDSLACIQQTLDARPVRGKRLVLGGWFMGRDPAQAGFWIEVFGPRDAHNVALMIEDPDRVDSISLARYRTLGWEPFVAWLVVPAQADSFRVGASLRGDSWGRNGARIDALEFEIQLAPGATTPSRPPPPPYPQPVLPVVALPVNLSFEQ